MRDALAVVVLVAHRALAQFQVATMREPVQNAKKNGDQQENKPSDRRSHIPRPVGFVRALLVRLIRLVLGGLRGGSLRDAEDEECSPNTSEGTAEP
eukprot:scaffold22545_cov72-Phaeocystis_antarctica.AAC.1